MSTDNLFQSSGKGSLSADKINQNPVMPLWAPLMPKAQTYKYLNIDMAAVAFATDRDRIAALVPDHLDLVALPGMEDQACASLIFAKYRGNEQIGPYMETIVTIAVLADGIPFLYVPAIYVDSDAAMAAGREFGGYPKKLATITMRTHGDIFANTISRGGMQQKTSDPNFSDIASSQITRGEKLFSVPLPADNMPELAPPFNMLLPLPPATGEPQPFILPTIGLRTFPGVGEHANQAEIIQIIGTPWVVTRAEVWAGVDPTIDFVASEEDPLHDHFPVNAILGSFLLRGDMHTDPSQWLLIRDYKK